MIDHAIAEKIATGWVAAWNGHDAERVVAEFADDVVVRSPLIDTIVPGAGTELRGRDAVLAYYRKGLELIPDLRFELVDTLVGVAQMTIVYRNHRGVLVAERLGFDADDVVTTVDVAYGAAPAPG